MIQMQAHKVGEVARDMDGGDLAPAVGNDFRRCQHPINNENAAGRLISSANDRFVGSQRYMPNRNVQQRFGLCRAECQRFLE
jgi:hypothetical protein